MEDLIFVKTAHIYDSYSDFWQLVQLSGYEAVNSVDVDLRSSKTYVTAPYNGDWKELVDSVPKAERKAELIHWNIERPCGSSLGEFADDNAALIDAGYFDATWVSDRYLAELSKFHYVPLGSHHGLANIDVDVDYSAPYAFSHLMCYAPRRGSLFNKPAEPKLSWMGYDVAPNGWGDKRHQALLASWYMLSVHQDEHKIIEPLRFAIAASYGLPIIAEWSYDIYPYTTNVDVYMYINLEEVPGILDKLFEFEQYYINDSTHIRELMCDNFNFRNCIERFA